MNRLLLLAILLAASKADAVDIVDTGGPEAGARLHPALGIGETFGRWTGDVRFVYDPDGAPARFASQAHMADLLEQAWTQWERVSGLRFELADITPNAADDRELDPDRQDGLVRVSWSKTIGAAAAQAGPYYDFYDAELGYFPYADGSVELNGDANAIESDDEMVAVLVHELGHLIGLGHSDNPDSVMFANPYNFLRYPREDDIRAVRVLYADGAPELAPNEPLAEWVYKAPAEASASRTRYVFKANQQIASGAAFSVSGASVSSIGAGTPDKVFVQLDGGIGNHQNASAIDIDALVVLVDPSGYVHATREWDLACAAGFACERNIGIEQTQILKTLPGTWRVYVIDMSSGASNARTLLSLPLTVTGTVSRNRAPEVSVGAEPGATPDAVTFTLAATDPENHEVTVIWNRPGRFDSAQIIEALGTDGVARQTVDFGLTGEHTMFVELIDAGPRYGSTSSASAAGEGFQTLVRLTVKLPLTGASEAFTVIASSNDGAEFGVGMDSGLVPTAAELSAVADTPELDRVTTSTGAPTTARFRLGASRDRGVTTGASFKSTDLLLLAGAATVQAADVGKAGGIFVVMRSITASGDSWSYRDAGGSFRPWNGMISGLQPAVESASLPATSVVFVRSGNLPVGDHRVFIGYRLDGSGILHYTSFALRLTVTN